MVNHNDDGTISVGMPGSYAREHTSGDDVVAAAQAAFERRFTGWKVALDKQQADDAHPRDYPANAGATARIKQAMRDYTFIAGVTESPDQHELRLVYEELAQHRAVLIWSGALDAEA